MISLSENAGAANTITWTRPMLDKFKRDYNQAHKKHQGDMMAVFSFDGNEFLLGFAKYLIEFLDERLK